MRHFVRIRFCNLHIFNIRYSLYSKATGALIITTGLSIASIARSQTVGIQLTIDHFLGYPYGWNHPFSFLIATFFSLLHVSSSFRRVKFSCVRGSLSSWWSNGGGGM